MGRPHLQKVSGDKVFDWCLVVVVVVVAFLGFSYLNSTFNMNTVPLSPIFIFFPVPK